MKRVLCVFLAVFSASMTIGCAEQPYYSVRAPQARAFAETDIKEGVVYRVRNISRNSSSPILVTLQNMVYEDGHYILQENFYLVPASFGDYPKKLSEMECVVRVKLLTESVFYKVPCNV